MSWLSRITNVFRSDRLDQDLDDEQRFHLKARADELEERGVSREAACDRPHGGFEHDRVLIASTATDGYSVDQRKTFYALLLDNVRRIPGVVSAALANDAPLDVNTGWNILVQRDPAGPPRQAGASVAFISPDYFKTIGIPLVTGRDFDERDGASALRAVIVNENFCEDVPSARPGSDWRIGCRQRQHDVRDRRSRKGECVDRAERS